MCFSVHESSCRFPQKQMLGQGFEVYKEIYLEDKESITGDKKGRQGRERSYCGQPVSFLGKHTSEPLPEGTRLSYWRRLLLGAVILACGVCGKVGCRHRKKSSNKEGTVTAPLLKKITTGMQSTTFSSASP